MRQGFNFSKLVFLLTLVITYANTSNTHILQYHGPILYVKVPDIIFGMTLKIISSKFSRSKDLVSI